MYNEIWSYREHVLPDEPESGKHQTANGVNGDLAGYKVEALDGHIGHIDKANQETSSSYVVVDTGPWIFGKKVMLPAGVISRVDTEHETVAVNRTKEEIKNSPEFDESTYEEQSYRDQLGTYYGPEGKGHRDW